MKALAIPLLIFVSASLEIFIPLFSKRKIRSGACALVGLLAAVFLLFFANQKIPESFFMNAFLFSPFSVTAWFLILAVSLFFALISFEYSQTKDIPLPEYFALALFSLIGILFIVSTRNLFTIIICLELLSLPLYALTGIRRTKTATEAGMKYFLLGALGGSVAIMGIALIYGSFKTADLTQLTVLSKNFSSLANIGVLMIFAGFLFKAAVVPFHFWAADVYEASPTPVSAFMASVVKTAAILVLMRIFAALYNSQLAEAVWWLSLVTMVGANLMALCQENLKRLLGYSSISHAGYMLIGFLGGAKGFQGIFFYLIVYSLATFGLFAVISRIEERENGVNFSEISGLARRAPLLSAVMSVFALSLAGIPPLSGFFGKFYVFAAAVEKGNILLVTAAVIMSAVSLYYYLKIIVYMYMKDSRNTVMLKSSSGFKLLIFLIAVAIILIGLFSEFFLGALKVAAFYL